MIKITEIAKNIFSRIKNLLLKTNKYYLTGLIFLIITFIIGDSTLYKRYQYDRQIHELETEIEKNKKEETEKKEMLNAITSDNESLERFAREEYQMTKSNEELFLIR